MAKSACLQVPFDLVKRQVRKSYAIKRGVLDQVDGIRDQRSLDAHARFPAALRKRPRDCVGVKKFVDAHPRLSKMKVALYSQCLGGVSQYAAITKHPELFENVSCMCSPLVPNMASVFGKLSGKQGIGQYQELVDLEIMKLGGFPAADMSGKLWAPNVKLPLLMWQVLDDAVINNPTDAQSTFDALGSNDKELHWIEGTTKRFEDGYNWFGRYPDKVLTFLGKHMN